MSGVATDNPGGWYFLLGVLALYAMLALLIPDATLAALLQACGILLRIIPAFVLIFLLMWLVNAFVAPKRIARLLGKSSGMKGWLIAIAGGIISTGPIYFWYPLLSELQKHGVRNALIATFLYNRAIKLPLLPILLFYFGLPYTVLLALLTLLFSIPNGWLTEVTA